MVMDKDFIAFYIVLNIIFFTIILIRSLIWLIVTRKRKNTYIEYVLWSDMTDMDYIVTNVNTGMILISNLVMIIIWLTGVISGLL